MSLFTEYRYAEIEGQKILVTAKNTDQKVKFDLYKDGVLLQTHYMGMGDSHTFLEGDLRVVVHQKALKTEYKAYYKDRVYQLHKAKKQDLVANGILPGNKNEGYKIEPKALILPFAVLVIAGFLYHYLGRDTRTHQIITMGSLLAGGYLLTGVLLPKTDFFSNKTRGQIKLLGGIAAVIIISMLVDKIDYGSFEKGTLYQQLSTNSPSIKVEVKSVEYNESMRVRRRNYDASYSHLYDFVIDGKTYKGHYQSPFQVYHAGDSILVHYLADDPRINKHLNTNISN